MKMLNLDALVSPQMVVKFQGQDWPIEDVDVGLFLEATEEQQRLQEQGAQMDEREGVRRTRDMLKRLIPSMPVEVLNKMKFPQLFATLAFVNGKVGEAGEGAAQSLAAAEAAQAEEGDAGKP